ncbi:hypothetical protein ACRALDRAFT_2020200 [Sodiomyces alcalophilus JCM 7366]|uniref:uncharacterized protein n=1 Tax=Sodiomyces alcalophilus JCM 7366 TaxID=591952 RepID=UPI0039B48C7E
MAPRNALFIFLSSLCITFDRIFHLKSHHTFSFRSDRIVPERHTFTRDSHDYLLYEMLLQSTMDTEDDMADRRAGHEWEWETRWMDLGPAPASRWPSLILSEVALHIVDPMPWSSISLLRGYTGDRSSPKHHASMDATHATANKLTEHLCRIQTTWSDLLATKDRFWSSDKRGIQRNLMLYSASPVRQTLRKTQILEIQYTLGSPPRKIDRPPRRTPRLHQNRTHVVVVGPYLGQPGQDNSRTDDSWTIHSNHGMSLDYSSTVARQERVQPSIDIVFHILQLDAPMKFDGKMGSIPEGVDPFSFLAPRHFLFVFPIGLSTPSRLPRAKICQPFLAFPMRFEQGDIGIEGADSRQSWVIDSTRRMDKVEKTRQECRTYKYKKAISIPDTDSDLSPPPHRTNKPRTSTALEPLAQLSRGCFSCFPCLFPPPLDLQSFVFPKPSHSLGKLANPYSPTIMRYISAIAALGAAQAVAAGSGAFRPLQPIQVRQEPEVTSSIGPPSSASIPSASNGQPSSIPSASNGQPSSIPSASNGQPSSIPSASNGQPSSIPSASIPSASNGQPSPSIPSASNGQPSPSIPSASIPSASNGQPSSSSVQSSASSAQSSASSAQSSASSAQSSASSAQSSASSAQSSAGSSADTTSSAGPSTSSIGPSVWSSTSTFTSSIPSSADSATSSIPSSASSAPSSASDASSQSGTPTSSISPDPTGPVNDNPATIGNFAYVGCVGSPDGFPSFEPIESSDAMSIEICASAADGAYRFFGVNGRDCFGGENLASARTLPDALCDIACPGNPAQDCGGSLAQGLVRRQGLPSTILLTVYVRIEGGPGVTETETVTGIVTDTDTVTDTVTGTVTNTVTGTVTTVITQTTTATDANGSVTTATETITKTLCPTCGPCYGPWCPKPLPTPGPEPCRGDDCYKKIICYGDWCHYDYPCHGDWCHRRIVCKDNHCFPDRCDSGDCHKKVWCEGDHCKYTKCKGDECYKKKLVCYGDHCAWKPCHGDECKINWVCHDERECRPEPCTAKITTASPSLPASTASPNLLAMTASLESPVIPESPVSLVSPAILESLVSLASPATLESLVSPESLASPATLESLVSLVSLASPATLESLVSPESLASPATLESPVIPESPESLASPAILESLVSLVSPAILESPESLASPATLESLVSLASPAILESPASLENLASPVSLENLPGQPGEPEPEHSHVVVAGADKAIASIGVMVLAAAVFGVLFSSCDDLVVTPAMALLFGVVRLFGG